MPPPYGLWSLVDLRAELKRRRARISGRKADLVTEIWSRHKQIHDQAL